MLRRLFGHRPTHPPAQTPSFRPRLEHLENREAPAGMFPGTTPTYGPSVPTYDTSATSSSQGQFAYNSLSAFGLPPSAYALYALGGAPVSGYVAVPYQQANFTNNGGLAGEGGNAGNPVAQVESLVVALYHMAAAQNPQQANALVSDEFFRGLATYVDHLGQSLGLGNFMQGSLTAHQNAIDQNPISHTEVGQLLGALVFDLTFYAYSTGQAGAL